jgi:1-acyl-sn-glycerol-3-phosphate acyltransferase
VIDRLRTIVFAIVFYGLSVPIVLLAPIAGLFGRPAMIGYAAAWARFHRWATRTFLGIRARYEGVIPPGPVLFVAKHQAMYETLELAVELGQPATVMKRELAQIPVWGWASRVYGVIVVDRAASATALRKMMREAKEALGAGRSVLIFPEGTRVAPGEAPPLQAGFAGLYKILNLPVVPIALDSGRVWPRKGPQHPGTVTFRFGDVIPPGLPRAEAEARAYAAINALEQR